MMNHKLLVVAGIFASLTMAVGCVSQGPDQDSEDDADAWEADDMDNAKLDDSLAPDVAPTWFGPYTSVGILGGISPVGWDMAYFPYGMHHPYGAGLGLGLDCGAWAYFPTICL